jgi:hypothetical protein
MVDLPGREDFEAALARRVGREFATVRKRLVALLGDPPDFDQITPEIWREVTRGLNGAVFPQLRQVFVEATAAQAEAIGVAYDFDLVNARAQEWAGRYTYNMVTGVTNTSRTRLQKIVANYFEQGVTIGDTQREIAKLFGPVRAEMIAQTEVTRAATEGERAGARDLEAQGVRLRPIHQTNVDDRVCPICGPRHGQEITDGQFPPLHVKCRCWVTYEVVLEDET